MINNNVTRWVTGIIIVVYILTLLSLSYEIYGLVDSFNDLTSGYTQYESEEEYIEESLTEKGYEVISVYIGNYSTSSLFFEEYGIEENTVCGEEETSCYTDKVNVAAEMKSLGNRDDQVWASLITMAAPYSEAFTYKIWILSPTDTCKYLVFGETYRNWSESEDNNAEAYQSINDEIENYAKCE